MEEWAMAKKSAYAAVAELSSLGVSSLVMVVRRGQSPMSTETAPSAERLVHEASGLCLNLSWAPGHNLAETSAATNQAQRNIAYDSHLKQIALFDTDYYSPRARKNT